MMIKFLVIFLVLGLLAIAFHVGDFSFINPFVSGIIVACAVFGVIVIGLRKLFLGR